MCRMTLQAVAELLIVAVPFVAIKAGRDGAVSTVALGTAHLFEVF